MLETMKINIRAGEIKNLISLQKSNAIIIDIAIMLDENNSIDKECPRSTKKAIKNHAQSLLWLSGVHSITANGSYSAGSGNMFPMLNQLKNRKK